MSRSYKKIPMTTDHGKYTYIDKRMANKKVRHTKDIPDGGAFKKVFCSYDICDWKFGSYTYRELIKDILYLSQYRDMDLVREFYRRVSK
jgi:hypothetical protein